MNLEIGKSFAEHIPLSQKTKSEQWSGEFEAAVNDALFGRDLINSQDSFKGTVIISPQYEKILEQDSTLKAALAEKLHEPHLGCGKQCRNDITIVDKYGEISYYCLEREKKRFQRPESEEIKEAAKARARRKARLSAYFRRVERYSIKRKLIEQANVKRPRGKKLRISVTKLNTITESLVTIQNPLNPEYFF